MRTSLSLRIALVASFVIIAFAPPASAQDRTVGLVVGYPTTVGVLWQASERIGIRGEGSFSWSSSKLEDSGTNAPGGSTTHTNADGTTSTVIVTGLSFSAVQKTQGVTGSIGASLLITLTTADRFRTYLAPRIAWAISRSTTTIEYDTSRLLPQPTQFPGLPRGLFENQTITTTSTTPSTGAAFGASSAVHDRIGVFGEVGFSYSSSNQPLAIGSTIEAPVRTSRAVSLRSGIGAIIYF
jgi:hypothetical protein